LAFSAASPASHSTTPNDVKTIMVYWNMDILGLSLIELIIIVIRFGVDEIALPDVTHLDALASSETVSVATALRAVWCRPTSN
jgi:hypothetical protein